MTFARALIQLSDSLSLVALESYLISVEGAEDVFEDLGGSPGFVVEGGAYADVVVGGIGQRDSDKVCGHGNHGIQEVSGAENGTEALFAEGEKGHHVAGFNNARRFNMMTP